MIGDAVVIDSSIFWALLLIILLVVLIKAVRGL